MTIYKHTNKIHSYRQIVGWKKVGNESQNHITMKQVKTKEQLFKIF